MKKAANVHRLFRDKKLCLRMSNCRFELTFEKCDLLHRPRVVFVLGF